MADVDDRGQLLLVGALTFAVIMVALAVLLNAAIYTGNVATRDAGPGTGEAIEYENEAASMARSTIAAINDRETGSYPDRRLNFTGTVDTWSLNARTHASAALADASVEVLGDPTRGTAIRQTAERNMTDSNTDPNWTVANDTKVRSFRLNVSQDSLQMPPDDENLTDRLFGENTTPHYYQIRFDESDTTDQWTVFFAQNATDTVTEDVTILVQNDGTTIGDPCAVPAENDRVVVDVTDTQVGNQHCAALQTMFGGLDAPYTISYRNGTNATGTYSLVVDRRIDRLQTGADTTGGTEPAATRALYDADLRITYRTDGVYYRTEIRIAPGENDD